jgi:hypothetical protein
VNACALVALLVVLSAANDPGKAAAPAQELVPVIERGKPMRFEAVPPPAPETLDDAAPESDDVCTLPTVLDRRSTPSSSCTACHDGSRASDARLGHRFGFDYATARLNPLKASELRAEPESHNREVVLQNGVVGCVTCHSPTSQRDFHLAGPTGGPAEERLCAACHR